MAADRSPTATGSPPTSDLHKTRGQGAATEPGAPVSDRTVLGSRFRTKDRRVTIKGSFRQGSRAICAHNTALQNATSKDAQPPRHVQPAAVPGSAGDTALSGRGPAGDRLPNLTRQHSPAPRQRIRVTSSAPGRFLTLAMLSHGTRGWAQNATQPSPTSA